MKRRTVNPSTLVSPRGYSQVVEVSGGTTIYLAGQVPVDAEGRLVGPGDFEAQARQSLTNLVHALAEVGATPSDLVKIGTYIVGYDADKREVLRRVRDEFLVAEPRPASTLLGVVSLARPEFMIETDGIAVI